MSIGSRAGVASVTLVPDDGVHISSQNSVWFGENVNVQFV